MPTIVLRRDRLAEVREERHLHSDSQLADALRLHKGTVSRVLSGKSVPGPRFIAAVVETFGLDFEEIFRVCETEASPMPEAVA